MNWFKGKNKTDTVAVQTVPCGYSKAHPYASIGNMAAIKTLH